MIVITIISIVLLLILIAWTWSNLAEVEKKLKFIYILVGIIIIYLITLVIFNISKNSIQYPNVEIANQVKNTLVFLFTPLNGMIILPYLAKLFGRIKYNEIDQDEFKKKFLISIIIFIIILFIECTYLKSVQSGILQIFSIYKSQSL